MSCTDTSTTNLTEIKQAGGPSRKGEISALRPDPETQQAKLSTWEQFCSGQQDGAELAAPSHHTQGKWFVPKTWTAE